jgi:hypothetical protein
MIHFITNTNVIINCSREENDEGGIDDESVDVGADINSK